MADKGATRRKVKCSTPSQMREGTSAVEIEVNADRAVVAGRLKGETPTNGKRTATALESLVEGEVITPDHPSVTTHPNADTVENTATMKRSAEKRHAKDSDYDDRSGMYINHSTDSDYDELCRMFVMRHEAQSMLAQASTYTSASNNVWFVDSGASNHMTSHEDWFRELHAPEHPGYVKTSDDTTHPIQHIGNVPFGNNGLHFRRSGI